MKTSKYIFSGHNPLSEETTFVKNALSVFRFQFHQNKIYRKYCQLLKIHPNKIKCLEDIPFLPVSFFKTHRVTTTVFIPEKIFSSSGTTAANPALHHVKSLQIYEKSFTEGFRYFYGDPSNYVILALLPGYLEREGSSLIYMMQRLIAMTRHPDSGFYLHEHETLYHTLVKLKQQKQRTILFGVSFALLDFIASYSLAFPELILFETGGMKGRRQEMVKEELHHELCKAFNIKKVHSEYGMCELLSQAYSQGNNTFVPPPWMRLLLRDERDPLAHPSSLMQGAINIIDLANLYSCAFIATDDLGKRHANGSIEIMGRLDQTDIRGCNMLI
ncbi:MAG: acyltransferase [Bacteroidales bacterium]|jgi:phenylacetate-coenzyme A ligase PaaK-like adenylate-forming protein|nr:acyltransferase [Bacteroidales bacterium]